MRSFKKWCIVFLFLLFCIFVSPLMDYLLKPSNIVRLTMHQLEDGKEYEDIFIGTSHGQYGISPDVIDKITGRRSMNLCMADEYPVDMYYILKDAWNKKHIKRVIYEIDPAYWVTDEPKASTSMYFLQEMKWSLNKLAYWKEKIGHLDFRETLFGWSYYRNLLPKAWETIRTKQSEAYQNYSPECVQIPEVAYKGRGFSFHYPVENLENENIVQPNWHRKHVRERAVKYLKKIIEFCKRKNIQFQMVVFPVPEDQLKKYRQDKHAADSYIKKFAELNKITYYNFNTDVKQIRWNQKQNFWDYEGHMNGPAAEEFSKVLGKYLCQTAEKL